MVHEDADLVVLEFSANDKRDAPYSDPERKGYEQLIRKLLKLPGRCAASPTMAMIASHRLIPQLHLSPCT